MKMKAVLLSLLFSYGLTGLILALLAFFMYRFTLPEAPVLASLTAVYVLSGFLGGYLAGRMIRKEKYLWGMLSGLAYFLLLIAVSALVKGKWDMTWMHAVTVFFLCLGGGTLGGMLA